MRKIKLSDIYVLLKSGNVEESVRMYQLYGLSISDKKLLTSYIVHDNDCELFCQAERQGMLCVNVSICDLSAGVSLSMLCKCIGVIFNQYNSVALCVTEEASRNASRYGHLDVLQYLFDNDCPFTWSASVEAIRYDRLEIFKWLELNLPGRTYHSYELRTKQPTYHIPMYLYSKGYIPTPLAYRLAVQCGDDDYVQWLHSTLGSVCDFGHLLRKFRNSVIQQDYQTIASMFSHQLVPPLTFTKDDPFILLLPNLCKYLFTGENTYKTTEPQQQKQTQQQNQPSQHLFQYIGHNMRDYLEYLFFYIMNNQQPPQDFRLLIENGRHPHRSQIQSQRQTKTPPQPIDNFNVDLCLIDYLKYTYPNQFQLATIYVDLLTYLPSAFIVFKYLTDCVDWKIVFLIELQNWVSCHTIYQPSELLCCVDLLWDKYSRKIPQLCDIINKEDWDTLKSDQPWYDQIYSFLSYMMNW